MLPRESSIVGHLDHSYSIDNDQIRARWFYFRKEQDVRQPCVDLLRHRLTNVAFQIDLAMADQTYAQLLPVDNSLPVQVHPSLLPDVWNSMEYLAVSPKHSTLNKQLTMD
jgi:hypothetical protein